jgi:hypothetical protein
MNSDKNIINYFAETDSRNKRTPFGIKTEDRSRHMYVIGKTGMGKSTLLENMAIQDIRNGEGLAFIDPHGKTADLLLDYVPQERMKDVLYFAPFDLEYPISFNVMEDVGYEKRHLVANGLMSAFKKIWVDAWSARMEYILNNILLALLEYPDSTLVGVNRMLVDKEYRKKVVDNITDPSVKAFWVDEYAKYTDRFAAEAAPAIQNKIGQFISNPLVRNIIGQPKSTFDLRTMMDDKKIIIVNLSKGRVGESNANLLGSMLITKIYLAAMSRADSSPALLRNLPNFYLYVDEFQSFANESFADILSEARKYKLNLTIAHQYVEQMSEEVRSAVFGNVGTMITFRVGAMDSELLEREFFPTFTKEDVVNLDRFQMYLKLMIDGVSSPPFSASSIPPLEKPAISFKEDIIRYSRASFARPRASVEDEIRKWHEPIKPEPKKPSLQASGQQGTLSRAEQDQKAAQRALEDLKKFPQPHSRAESRESDLRKAISINYADNAPLDQKPEGERGSREDNQTNQNVGQNASQNNNQNREQSRQGQPKHQKNSGKNAKNPSPENMSALRAALSSIITDNQKDTQKEKLEKTERSEQPKAQPQQVNFNVNNIHVESKVNVEHKTETKAEPKTESQPQPKPEPEPVKAEEPKASRQKQEIPPEPNEPLEVPEEVLKRIFDIER